MKVLMEDQLETTILGSPNHKVLELSAQYEQEDLLWCEDSQVMGIGFAWASIEQQRQKIFEFLCTFSENI